MDYFESYGDLEVHRIMLKDEPRCMAYGNAILSNELLFKDKIVMDVGAGTGVLSLLCAKAGATRVYAVEGSEKMVEMMKKVIAENDCDKIEIVAGDVEDVHLDVEVDILVSEWMGFTLLHEGMLSSVLVARDRFLKEDGIILPDSCQLYVSLCKTPSLFNDYENVDGINMGHFGLEWRSLFDGKPEIYALKKDDGIISNTETILNFNIKEIQLKDLEVIKKHIQLKVTDETFCDALCLWFEVNLLDRTLSTSPLQPETHWKQTLIVLPERLNVRKGNTVDFELSMEQERRRYVINVSKFDWKENS